MSGIEVTARAIPDPAAARRRWLALGVIGIAQLMVVLDLTVMNIALPSAQRALHFTTADRQWVVTAYSLAFGSLLLAGRLVWGGVLVRYRLALARLTVRRVKARIVMGRVGRVHGAFLPEPVRPVKTW